MIPLSSIQSLDDAYSVQSFVYHGDGAYQPYDYTTTQYRQDLDDLVRYYQCFHHDFDVQASIYYPGDYPFDFSGRRYGSHLYILGSSLDD